MQIATKLRIAAIFLAIMTLVLLASRTVTTDAATQPAVTSATVDVQHTTEDGLQFSLTLPTAEVSSVGELTVAGLEGQFSTVGEPDLPFYSTLIAVPPEADVRISVTAKNETTRATDAIAPVPTANVDGNSDFSEISTIDDFDQEYVPDAVIYGEDLFFPSGQYVLSEPMYMGDLRVVQLTLYPVRYNPVAQTLSEVGQFDVNLTFSGGRTSAEATPSSSTTASVLNPDQAANWHALPDSFQPRATSFPIGKQTLKITVDTDGIYKLTANDLTSAGMAAIDPNTIEMMWQNQPVAYQFIGDNDAQFEAGEEIRFYGWAFDGSRHDKLYVGEKNVFWLWADGSPTLASSESNGSGGTAVTEWRSTVEKADKNFYSTGGILYSSAATRENEANAWYLLKMANHVTETVSVELPDPVATGSNAYLLVEVTNFSNTTDQNFSVILNDANQIDDTWHGLKNRNLVKNDVNHAILADGANSFELISNHINFSNDMLVRRIHVEYDRDLTAINDTLLFNYAAAGNHTFQVNGYTESDANDFAAWDITNRNTPTVVALAVADITLASGNNTVNLTINHPADSNFLITTASKLLAPLELETYTASSLEPAAGSAEWVAVAYNTFLADTNDLAQHRAAYSALSTHVVDVQDVYNQYGYGLATPIALQNFFAHTRGQWGMQYAVLVGDATENPQKLPCSRNGTALAGTAGCPDTWSTTDENFVLTDFQFVDRFKGMVASDHTFTTIIGNDELEDFAIGRLTAGTVTELKSIVAKIKLFENELRSGAAWTNNMVWYADNNDLGGNFCHENAGVRNNHVDESFTHEEICLPENTAEAISAARAEFFNILASSGARIINYRGHGSAATWGEGLMSINAIWSNPGTPAVILSADCLDGNFMISGQASLGESILSLSALKGSAGHWSSSGLGYSHEHTVLHEGFYDGLYDHDQKRIGDAIRYSKNHYISGAGGDISEPYSFILQADPAMRMLGSEGYQIFLPTILK